MPDYWQISAGAYGRDYSKYFLKYGMAFVGGKNYIATMMRLNLNDIVILKQGKSEIVAVGRVIQKDGNHVGRDDREWLKDFDGWELPAYCYVDWRIPEQRIPTPGLAIGAIAGGYNQEVLNLAKEILNTGKKEVVSREPSESKTVEVIEILKLLIKEGLRPSAADELANTISRITLLADYYYNAKYGGGWIREHETRTFLVVPLLLALGWAEQQMKIEMPYGDGNKRIDIACFKKNYQDNKDDCVAIIETKGFSYGLDYAQKQAEKYSEKFPSCEVLITTNGYCYKIYKKNGANEFKTDPSAYMNLLKLTKKYPIDPENVDGALEAIKWLLPNRYSG